LEEYKKTTDNQELIEEIEYLNTLDEEYMETLAHAMRTDDLPDSYWDNLEDHAMTLFRKKCLEQESL